MYSLTSLTALTAVTLCMFFFAPVGNIAISYGKPLTVSKKVAPFLLEHVKTGTPQDILIELSAEADLSDVKNIKSFESRKQFVYDRLRTTALKTQKPLLKWLRQKGRDGQFVQSFYIANLIAVNAAPPELILKIALRDDVKMIWGNPVTKGIPPFEDPVISSEDGRGVEPNIERTGASRVWTEFNVTGAGVVVASPDTGVHWEHPALKKKYRGFSEEGVTHQYHWHDAIKGPLTDQNENKCGYNLSAPCDDNGHGTHTTGTIVGDDGAENQIGMAPGARWIACRNMESGLGRPSTYIECFEFFLAPYRYGENPMTDGKPAEAAHVINNSWVCIEGEGCSQGVFISTLKSLYSAGIMVVASAGNWGPSCATLTDPPAANSQLTLSVGAYNHWKDVIASFSSRGPSTYDRELGPDVVAPGIRIRSSASGGKYLELNGTSMAGPHVVGLVALIWSSDPTLIGRVDETTKIVRLTATPQTSSENCGGVVGSKIPNNTFGYGLIDAYKAVGTRLVHSR